MDIKNLKQGDILLFSPEKGSFISWAITFLTDAPVSHAAMYYSQRDHSIIEETPPQVRLSRAVERFKDREIYVRRLNNPAHLPLTPVINEATHYLNELEPYDKSGLYMVGLLLLYKKFTPNTLTQKVIVKIMKKVTASIMNHLHKHKNPGKIPMVCSQFVAQCYGNAGNEYVLKIEQGVLQKFAFTPQTAATTLVDQVLENLPTDTTIKNRESIDVFLSYQNDLTESDEDLCRELQVALQTDQTTAVSTPVLSEELIEAVSHFSQIHYSVKSGAAEPQHHEVTIALKSLKNDHNMYVFPGDLLKHCKNITDVGTIASS